MAYVAGSGPDEPADFAGLCAFACEYNMCPNPCECLKTGKAKTPPASDGTVGTAQKGTPGATRCASLLVVAVSALGTYLCEKSSGGGGGDDDGQPSGGSDGGYA